MHFKHFFFFTKTEQVCGNFHFFKPFLNNLKLTYLQFLNCGQPFHDIQGLVFKYGEKFNFFPNLHMAFADNFDCSFSGLLTGPDPWLGLQHQTVQIRVHPQRGLAVSQQPLTMF